MATPAADSFSATFRDIKGSGSPQIQIRKLLLTDPEQLNSFLYTRRHARD
ncbi:MAG: hypothetical protein ACU841_02470 [Gammaproteobacteria bacterium]